MKRPRIGVRYTLQAQETESVTEQNVLQIRPESNIR